MEVAECLWALEEEVGWVPLLPPSQRGSDPAERRVWSLHLDLAAFCIAEREIGTIQLIAPVNTTNLTCFTAHYYYTVCCDLKTQPHQV